MKSEKSEQVWLVARREIQEGGRTKAYRVTTAILIVAVAAAVVIPALLSRHHTEQLGVVGGDAASTQLIQQAGKVANESVNIVAVPNLAAAEVQLRTGTLDAVLVNGQELYVKQLTGTGRNSSGSTFVDALSQLGGLARLFRELPPGAASQLGDTAALPVRGLVPSPRPLSTRLTGVFAGVLIYFVISIYGQRITVGVGEEKANRIVEVILATIRPVQLLSGKVLGLGALALGQVAALVATFLIAGYATGSTLVHGASIGVVVVAFVWTVVGYAFFCTAFAAAGSLVERPSDATAVAVPLVLPLLLAYVLSFTVVSGGASLFYRVLAFLPPTAPVANTVLYAAGTDPPWQVAISVVLTLAATVGMAKMAGVVYERAILQTGGRLRVRKVLRSAGSDHDRSG